jgi:hypothetical protein
MHDYMLGIEDVVRRVVREYLMRLEPARGIESINNNLEARIIDGLKRR